MSSEVTDEHDRFDRTLREALTRIEIEVGEEQRAVLYQHYRLVIEANRSFNLTRITSPEDAAVKHYADSLSVLRLPHLDRQASIRVLDIGTGAGFPAAPLAVACPAWQICAIDGTGKKARFTADAVKHIGLTNLHVVHTRAETMVKEAKDVFDLILLRAVTDLKSGITTAAPLIGKTGLLVFYKTSQTGEQELREGERLARHNKLKALPPVQVTIAGASETYERVLLAFLRPA